MNVREICRRGYFDKLVVDGYMMPMYNNKGIQIGDDQSLVDAIETNSNAHNQGVGKLKINIMGEALKNGDTIDDMIYYEEHRENKLGLIRQDIGTSDRYSIGYVDILILKSDYSFPDNVTNKGKTEDDISKLAKCEDELELLLRARDIQNDIIKENNGIDDCNIAIIDKLFVNKWFRQCGISSWVHNNIGDITKVYGMLDVAAVLLMPGDFTDAAGKEFGMSTKQYTNMLIKHYKKQGYKYINDCVMYKKLVKRSRNYFIHFGS